MGILRLLLNLQVTITFFSTNKKGFNKVFIKDQITKQTLESLKISSTKEILDIKILNKKYVWVHYQRHI